MIVRTITTSTMNVRICLVCIISIVIMFTFDQPSSPGNMKLLYSALAFQPGCRIFSGGYRYHYPVTSIKSAVRARTDNREESDEPDLFEYFDPLLSPHAYPDGVSPKTKPIVEKSNQEIRQQQQQQQQRARMGFLGVSDFNPQNNDSVRPASTNEPSTTGSGGLSNESTGSKDLFEYFDPLLSPHSYPNGISPTAKPREMESTTRNGVVRSSPSTSTLNNGRRNKIGILLMDHGSRNGASNARLVALANLYQLTLEASSGYSTDGPNNNIDYVVKAAHMEIVSPTIRDGLQSLMDAGVDEIICHPYFLSPGRHVQVDIPTMVNDAIVSMKINIPVITTPPVGSNTQLMLGAIHSLVRESSQLLKTTDQLKESS